MCPCSLTNAVGFVDLAKQTFVTVRPKGRGKDIWAVPTEDITEFIKVSAFPAPFQPSGHIISTSISARDN